MRKWAVLVAIFIMGASLVYKFSVTFKTSSPSSDSTAWLKLSSPASEKNTETSTQVVSDEAAPKRNGRKLLEPIQLITENPENAEIKLQEYADSLDANDVLNLKQNVLNTQLSGDERLISVELILRAKTENHDSTLVEIANSAPVDHKNQTRNDEELAFRARAIEGIQSLPALQQVIDRNSNKFLSDRASRALAHLSGQAPSLREQDEAALKKLVN